MLVPCVVLYWGAILAGCAGVPGRPAAAAAWSGVGVVVLVVAVSEIAVTHEIFLSDYNWFHLP